jgi:transcriptional regulator with XRE-family HTH domain
MQALYLTVSQFSKQGRLGWEAVPARQKPFKAMGRFFRGLRKGRGWGLRQAAKLAERRRLHAVTTNSLGALERGETKNPEPELLRDLARLYEMSYAALVQHVIECRYGISITRDLTRQSDGVQPTHSLSAEVTHDAGSSSDSPSRSPLPVTGYAAEEAAKRIIAAAEVLTLQRAELVRLADALLRAATPDQPPDQYGATGSDTAGDHPSTGTSD